MVITIGGRKSEPLIQAQGRCVSLLDLQPGPMCPKLLPMAHQCVADLTP